MAKILSANKSLLCCGLVAMLGLFGQNLFAAPDSSAAKGSSRDSSAATAAFRRDQASWARKVANRITSRWRRPLDSASLKCTIELELSSAGEVLSAKIIRSSDSADFDRSVLNAVQRAVPLPLPSNKAVFEPKLRLNFVAD